ncbi:MAG: ankyrin repeat domain-containing protein [Rhodospirillaceae bacterium]
MPQDLSRRRFMSGALSAVALLWAAPAVAQMALPLESPIATALINGDNDTLRRMLLSGTDPNSRDTNRQPLIILAARNGLGTGMDLLLDNRARVDELDPFGNTALMWTADRGHADMTARLLAAGARPNLQNNQGVTALMRAAKEGHGKIVELLLAAGADPKATDYTGRGPLSWAREGRSRAVVRTLEAAGAAD